MLVRWHKVPSFGGGRVTERVHSVQQSQPVLSWEGVSISVQAGHVCSHQVGPCVCRPGVVSGDCVLRQRRQTASSCSCCRLWSGGLADWLRARWKQRSCNINMSSRLLYLICSGIHRGGLDLVIEKNVNLLYRSSGCTVCHSPSGSVWPSLCSEMALNSPHHWCGPLYPSSVGEIDGAQSPPLDSPLWYTDLINTLQPPANSQSLFMRSNYPALYSRAIVPIISVLVTRMWGY